MLKKTSDSHVQCVWSSSYENRSQLTGPGSCPPCLSDRARLALSMLPSELGLPLLQQQQQLHSSWHGSVQQLGLIILLLALMWFLRLYLHYCSQWLYLQAIAVPVNKWVCFLWYCPAHTHTCMEEDRMNTHTDAQNFSSAHIAADINPLIKTEDWHIPDNSSILPYCKFISMATHNMTWM